MHTLMEKSQLDNSAAKHFALCESCFWSATVLRMEKRVICPTCTDSDISLIPLAIVEQYKIKLGSSAGLELSFSKRR